MKTETLFSSKSDEWETPDKFFQDIDQEFHFDLDACATPDNAKCENYFTAQQDGLKQNWEGHTVWCNPPYSKVKDWIRKCYHEGRKPNTTVVVLVFSRTDTRWWQNYVQHRSEVRFVKGRLKFGGAENNAPFPSALIIYRGPEEGSDMSQYCRYCTQACAQSEDTAWCEFRRVMVSKTARCQNCEGYEFCKIDAFYGFRGLEPEDPRAHYKPKTNCPNDNKQMTWGDYDQYGPEGTLYKENADG